jgi:hypothetical protein
MLNLQSETSVENELQDTGIDEYDLRKETDLSLEEEEWRLKALSGAVPFVIQIDNCRSDYSQPSQSHSPIFRIKTQRQCQRRFIRQRAHNSSG